MSKLTEDPLLDDANQTFYSAPKNANFMLLGDVATGADRAEYFMAPNPPPPLRGKPFPFKPNQICFYSNLGKVFPLRQFKSVTLTNTDHIEDL